MTAIRLTAEIDMNQHIATKEKTMNQRTEEMANQAVFQLQFRTREAVRYVMRNAQVQEKEAERAIRSVATFHRQPKADSWKSVTV